ncbi:MAG: hypothetical protein Q8L57_03245, partial [bacterium]|nr:hypothetical protein [bacterium]
MPKTYTIGDIREIPSLIITRFTPLEILTQSILSILTYKCSAMSINRDNKEFLTGFIDKFKIKEVIRKSQIFFGIFMKALIFGGSGKIGTAVA